MILRRPIEPDALIAWGDGTGDVWKFDQSGNRRVQFAGYAVAAVD
jgi:hypothetical protein